MVQHQGPTARGTRENDPADALALLEFQGPHLCPHIVVVFAERRCRDGLRRDLVVLLDHLLERRRVLKLFLALAPHDAQELRRLIHRPCGKERHVRRSEHHAQKRTPDLLACHVQRRLVLAVANVAPGGVIKEALDAGLVRCARRDVQRGVSIAVSGVHLRASPAEEFDDVLVATGRRPVQCRVAAPVRERGGGAGVEQLGRHGEGDRRRRQIRGGHEGREAEFVRFVENLRPRRDLGFLLLSAPGASAEGGHPRNLGLYARLPVACACLAGGGLEARPRLALGREQLLHDFSSRRF
mmetsp:Transcript_5112/g.14518  ORF Transcript_5112/g.14518 Transcript_5112/m.14518 type:complete len:297 (-) Transcript_5112:18-908(-)